MKTVNEILCRFGFHFWGKDEIIKEGNYTQTDSYYDSKSEGMYYIHRRTCSGCSKTEEEMIKVL